MDTVVPPKGSQTEYYLNNADFSKPFDPENEQSVFSFLTQSLEEAYSKLKPREYYKSRVVELESNIDSLDTYHLLNVNRLHLDESDILRSNLEYLAKARSAYIKSLY
jgi:hypothetical protein